jgi:hypothetical protein
MTRAASWRSTTNRTNRSTPRGARAWLALVAAVALGGCGGSQHADGGPSAAGGAGGATTAPIASAAPDARKPIERRRDAACDQLGPKITTCAVDDAKADFAAGKIDRAQLERDTAPEVQRKNTEKFATECKGHAYSSRQIRVLEVCFHEEPRCAPLLDCLGHLSDVEAKPPASP